MTEPKPMKEIHEIQEKIYREEKDMSGEEKLETIREAAEQVKKKFALELKEKPLQQFKKAA